MNWYLKVMKQYADFNGRARRTEYWMFILFNLIFTFAAMVLDRVLGLNFSNEITSYGFIYLIYVLATVIPGIAVAVRRLHDVDKSGWYYLLIFIPLIGAIWLLILFCTEGTPGRNQYGFNPKEDDNEINEIGQKEF